MKLFLEDRVPDRTLGTYWRISLLVGAVVIGVVAFLLNTLLRTAEQINDGAAALAPWGWGSLTIRVPRAPSGSSWWMISCS